MTERNNKEIIEVHNELKAVGFEALWARARERRAQLYKHPSYLGLLTAPLPARLKSDAVPVPGNKVDHATWQTEAILDMDLQIHVEPNSKETTDAGNVTNMGRGADKAELFFAHGLAIRMGIGALRRWTHRLQAVGPYATWWLEWEEFRLPQDEEAREKYRKSYWPFRLLGVDPLTVCHLPDDNGKPTVSSREFELTYIEIARRYGKHEGDDPNPLTILGEQFGFLRGARGEAADGANVGRKKAKVCVVDDGINIAHYIDIGSTDNGEYRQVGNEGKDIPNPWGGLNSLKIITGRFNGDAEALEDRYMGLMETEFGASKNVDMVNSLIASIALHPEDPAQVIPESIAAALLDGGTLPPQVIEKLKVTNLYGDYAAMPTADSAGMTILREHTKEEQDSMMPSPYLTNPDQLVVNNPTASARLSAQETASKSYDNARESETEGIVDVCKSMVNFFGPKGYLSKTKGESVAFTVTGKEPTAKYRGDEKGTSFTVDADDFEDFDENYTLEVTIAATTQGQKRDQFELKAEEVKAGVSTMEDLIGTVYSDVSGQVKKLEVARRYQQQGSVIDNLDFLAALEAIRLDSGRDYSQIAMAAGLVPGGMGGGQQPAMEPEMPADSATVRVATPATEVGAAGAVG